MPKVKKLFHKYFPFIAAIYFAVALFVFKDDYFFGDAITSTSRLANFIYQQGIYFYPQGYDPGHPPTYSILLVFCWKIFGKTLFVSHVYGVFWCVMMFWGFRKLSLQLVNLKVVNYASLLFLAHPTFISQNAMMLNTAMLTTCFFWALYFLVSKQNVMLTFILSVMVISHLQGAFFLASIAGADFIMNRKEYPIWVFIRTKFLIYAIPFVAFCVWLWLHYLHTGWWLISPDFGDATERNTAIQILKGFAYCAWRFADYGMILPIAIYLILKFKSKNFSAPDTLLWTTLAVTSIIMSFILKNTIAHRYFLGFELLLLLLTVKEIQQNVFYAKTYFVIIFFALVVGNFLYYPGKTIADANMMYRGYFKAIDEVYSSIRPNQDFYSKAPIANPHQCATLQTEDTYFKRIDGAIDNLPAIVSSNVCAEFTSEELNLLSHWYGKSYVHGAVFINVYLNPRFYDKPEGWKLREPGIFESWMIHMKHQLK
ncbi:MAG: hypothetical protein NTW54_13205 [Bacteroidetes bacterium]|nr:hypothetical protein [Bacteroidota bacterium]